MKINVIQKNKRKEPLIPNEMLKDTALLYLDEALTIEQYEKCADLIQTAKKYGAKQAEVSLVISNYIKRLKNAPKDEAYANKEGHLRF